MTTIAKNKQALHNYQIIETIEAGLVLSGSETKSIKLGRINLKGSYINIMDDSNAILKNTHISNYKPASVLQKYYNPTQDRKLLLHKKQIRYLLGKSKEKTLTIIPTKIYLKNNLIKIEIAIARGIKKYDKRELLKKRDFEKRKQSLKNLSYQR